MTLIRISPTLSVGDLSTCATASSHATAVIHACKDPCHRRAIGCRSKISPDHPHYLAVHKQAHLYLNIIDPPLPLFRSETFEQCLSFYDTLPGGTPLHIHCNQGQSRAPSIALLLMAKRIATLPNSSFAAARAAFTSRYPYKPGKGIETFLTQHWDQL